MQICYVATNNGFVLGYRRKSQSHMQPALWVTGVVCKCWKKVFRTSCELFSNIRVSLAYRRRMEDSERCRGVQGNQSHMLLFVSTFIIS